MKPSLAVTESDMSHESSIESKTSGTILGRVQRLLPRRRGTRVAALVMLLALAAGGVYGVHAWTARDDAAARYTVATVQRGDLEDAVTATGILQPRDYVDVGTQVSGQV